MSALAAALALILTANGLPLAEGPGTSAANKDEASPLWAVQTIIAYDEAPSAGTESETASIQPEATIQTPSTVPPDARLRISKIGPANDDIYVLTQTLRASPDSGSVTYRQRFGPEVEMDGVAVNATKIITATKFTDPTFSPDSKGVAFVVVDRGWKLYYDKKMLDGFEPVSPVRFTPDGHRMFYLAREEDKQFVVDDAYAHPPADEVLWDQVVSTPNSSVIAYPARINGGWRMVINGDPGPRWDRFVSAPISTPNSRRIFFIAVRDGHYHVVDRHTPGPAMYLIDTQLAYSDDGKTFAYWAMGPDKVWRLFRNHRYLPDYDSDRPGELAISANGQSLAAVVKRQGQWFVVQDGEAGQAYTAIGKGSLQFSADGARIAYAVRKSIGWAVVIDGEEQPTYPHLAANSLRFSPDGHRFIYVALDQGKWQLVDTKQSHPPFSQINVPSIAFSPNSNRIVYLATNLDRPALVVDGQLISEYDEIQHPTFSPDSKHLVYVAKHAGEQRLFVDGFPTHETFDELVPGARIHFLHNTICQTVVIRRPTSEKRRTLTDEGMKRRFPAGPTFWRFRVHLFPTPHDNPNGTPAPQTPEEAPPEDNGSFVKGAYEGEPDPAGDQAGIDNTSAPLADVPTDP